MRARVVGDSMRNGTLARRVRGDTLWYEQARQAADPAGGAYGEAGHGRAAGRVRGRSKCSVAGYFAGAESVAQGEHAREAAFTFETMNRAIALPLLLMSAACRSDYSAQASDLVKARQ